MDNLDGYDSSDGFLLGGEEHSNAIIANENGRIVIKVTLHKKWRIYSENVTKSKANCGFVHIYWKNP